MNKKIYLIIGILVLIIAIVVGFVVYNNINNKSDDNNKEDVEITNEEKENQEEKDENMDEQTKKNPIVTMKVKDFGTVKIELYPEYAPNTVANFVSLVSEGYYDGLTFHRVAADFVIQGGDKTGTGRGQETFTIPGEFRINGYKNNLKHEKGVISMARADYSSLGDSEITKKGYDSASTQFFIMLDDYASLNGYYAAFGKVIEGMEVVEKIGEIETDATGERPINPPVIESMTVETFGIDYDEPTRYEPFDISSYIM